MTSRLIYPHTVWVHVFTCTLAFTLNNLGHPLPSYKHLGLEVAANTRRITNTHHPPTMDMSEERQKLRDTVSDFLSFPKNILDDIENADSRVEILSRLNDEFLHPFYCENNLSKTQFKKMLKEIGLNVKTLQLHADDRELRTNLRKNKAHRATIHHVKNMQVRDDAINWIKSSLIRI